MQDKEGPEDFARDRCGPHKATGVRALLAVAAAECGEFAHGLLLLLPILAS